MDTNYANINPKVPVHICQVNQIITAKITEFSIQSNADNFNFLK